MTWPRRQVPAVALFHHDPDRTDDQIDDIVAELSGGALEVFAAAEGQSVDLGVFGRRS